MSLYRRARIVRVLEENSPAADVLRLAQPPAQLDVLTNVRATSDSESAKDGVDFARLLFGLEASPRALAFWSWSHDVSKLAGSMLEEVAQALGRLPPGFVRRFLSVVCSCATCSAGFRASALK